MLINCNCGSRTAVGVLSFASPKESTQRKGDPGRGAAQRQRGTLRSSPTPSASRTRRRAKDNSARSGSNIVSRLPSGSAAVLGLLYGERNSSNHLVQKRSVFFSLSQPAEVSVLGGSYC